MFSALQLTTLSPVLGQEEQIAVPVGDVGQTITSLSAWDYEFPYGTPVTFTLCWYDLRGNCGESKYRILYVPIDWYIDDTLIGTTVTSGPYGCTTIPDTGVLEVGNHTWTAVPRGWGYTEAFGWAYYLCCACGPNPIRITQPPVVSTWPASDMTKESAVLHGCITDDGYGGCWGRFRYREEKGDYLYASGGWGLRTGQSFSALISGLKPNATYYFSAQATNSAGESAWGNEQTFVTRPGEVLALQITNARMVSPHELGIDMEVTFPEDAPAESLRKVNFWATVNGKEIFRTFDITRLVEPGDNKKEISFDYGSKWVENPVPPRTIDFADESQLVPRFDDNVEFTLHGTVNWEGGLYPEEATPLLVQIPLPVIIIHGYLYTYNQPAGWFLEQLAPVVYADLKKSLHDHGYADVDHSRYTTMWGMPDITYRAEELTESTLYLKVNDWVTNALQVTYANKVNLIGHSTGGLVARYYAGKTDTVDKVISVGTPHLGLTDFYTLAFEQSSRENAEKILRVPGTNLENLIRWFEPQYPEGSCLVNADTGEPMPELYESTFHPASNSDVHYYSIYANNRDTPYKLWVRQRNNGWYKVVDPPSGVATTSKGDGYVRAVSSSAGGGPIAIPGEGENSVNPHATLCKEPWVQEKILELLRR